jgi:hypothetical protein
MRAAGASIVITFVICLAAPSTESFEEAWQRLKRGRTYGSEKTGRFTLKYRAPDGELFDNVVEVPAEYSPTRRWPLRVQLHGGVGRPGPQAAPPGRPIAQHAPNRIPGEPQIYIYPSGWADAQWWDTGRTSRAFPTAARARITSP